MSDDSNKEQSGDNLMSGEAAAPADEAADINEVKKTAEYADQQKTGPVAGASLAALLRLAAGGARQSDKSALHAVELGVYRGRGLSVLLEQAMHLCRDTEWIGIDTFRGIPELSETDKEMAPENANYLVRPMFDDTTRREVEAFLLPIEKTKSLTLIEGRLEDIVNDLPNRKYAFVNVSIKLYEPTLLGLNYFYERMLPGGVIVLDDYFNRRFPMAASAVDRFLEGKPEVISQIVMKEPEGPNKLAFIIRGG